MSTPIADPLQSWEETDEYLKSLEEHPDEIIEILALPDQRKTFESVTTACIWYSTRIVKQHDTDKNSTRSRGGQPLNILAMEISQFDQAAGGAEQVMTGLDGFLNSHHIQGELAGLVRSGSIDKIARGVNGVFDLALQTTVDTQPWYLLIEDMTIAITGFVSLGKTYSQLLLESRQS